MEAAADTQAEVGRAVAERIQAGVGAGRTSSESYGVGLGMPMPFAAAKKVRITKPTVTNA